MNITMVKKIRPDGSLCRKLAEVTQKLDQLKLSDLINKVIFANEREYSSLGLEPEFSLRYPIHGSRI